MIESKELTRLNKKLDNIGANLFKVATEVPVDITRELALGANQIRNTIILSMRNTPQTGKIYKRGKKQHIASSPGNPPAIDSGDLLKSILFDVRDMEVEVGSIIDVPPYPTYLEEGTSKMKARPWLAPAVEKHEKEIIDNVGHGVFEIISKPFEKI